MEDESQIKKFYKDQTIFLTGGTGFIGKILIEKLLRVCYDLEKIYILVRPKFKKTPTERLNDIFDYACFDALKLKRPNLYEKVHLIRGDCDEPDLGLSLQDQETLKREVTIVIHAAANVKFDQVLRLATNSNVRAVRDLLNLSKGMPQLQAFVFVSTSYSNCPQTHVKEEFYEPPMTAENLFALVESVDDEVLDAITPRLLKKWPNTYTFSKCIAEDLVKREAYSLPIVIVRPAIIVSTYEEPIVGWTDNMYGVIGICVGILMGPLRNIHAKNNSPAHCVPCDFVVNFILAAIWNLGTQNALLNQSNVTKINNEGHTKIPIYNYTHSRTNLMKWGQLKPLVAESRWKYPPNFMIWFPDINIVENRKWYFVRVFVQHTLISYILDFLLICFRKKPIAINQYRKINKLLMLLSYFATGFWNFDITNVENLWYQMNDVDRKMFNFNMDDLDWRRLYFSGVKYGRFYLMKDPLETLPKARIKVVLFAILHYSFLSMLLYLLYKLVYSLVSLVY